MWQKLFWEASKLFSYIEIYDKIQNYRDLWQDPKFEIISVFDEVWSHCIMFLIDNNVIKFHILTKKVNNWIFCLVILIEFLISWILNNWLAL